MVCDIKYIGKKYKGEDEQYIVALHKQVEDELRSSGAVKKASGDPYFRPLNNTDQSYSKAREAVNKVNSVYENKVITTSRSKTGIPLFRVNVNSIADERLFVLKDAKEKIKNDPYGVQDGEVMNKEDLNYQKRFFNLDNQDEETLEAFAQKLEKMQKQFNSKGINTYVILDGDLNSSGEILSSDNNKVQELKKSGEISDSTIVIAVNPKNLFGDTLFHEYGHIFIDVIGGMNNPRVQAAYKKLEGTALYDRVRELYPELEETSDHFRKEVIVTALGMEADQIYQSQQDKSWWDRFTEWFSDKIKNLLGLEKDQVKELAKDLLNNNFNPQSEFKQVSYQKRVKKEGPTVREQLSTVIKDLASANKEIVSSINRIVTQFERRTGMDVTRDIPGDESKELAYVKALNNLKVEFERLKDNHSSKMIVDFITLRNTSAEKQLNFLRQINEKILNNQDYNREIVLEQLQTIKLYNETYKISQRIAEAFPEIRPVLGKETADSIKEVIDNSVKVHNDVMNEYRSVGRKLLVDLLTPLEDIMFTERKDELGIYYEQNKNKSTSDVKANETKQEFIDRMIDEERSDLIEQTRNFINDELEETITDIGTLELYLRSEMNINSTIIRLTKKILDGVDFKRDRKFLSKRQEAINLWKEYNEKYGSTNMKKMWEPLLDETSDQVFLKGEYKAELYELEKNLWKEYNEARDKDDAESLKRKEKYDKNTREINKKITKFYKENYDEVKFDHLVESVQVPKDKWKNPEYASIMKNPQSIEARMLNFLTNTLDESNKNYFDKATLKRTSGSAVWYRLPSMGRDSLEKLSGGDYIENAKDSFERMYKWMGDETDAGQTGDIEDEGSEPIRSAKSKFFKNVLADQVGSEKHIIPIHFRGKMNKKTQSYDVLTAVMTDSYASITHNERSQVLPVVDLILNMNENKKVTQTDGIRTFFKTMKLNATQIKAIEKLQGEGTKEHQKLQSMVENRLYGIETIGDEYAKISQTIMAWTGSTMLALNFYAGLANVMQGQVMNFIEAFGGQFFNSKNLARGEIKYLRDLGNIIGDLENLENTSRTNLLLEVLDPQGEFRGLKEKFVRSNRAKALAQSKNLAAPNHIGEHFIQGQLMYAITDNIKVKDKNGKYLDRNFRPTDDVKSAISLDEAIEFKDGVAVLNENVHSTTFSDTADGNHEQILLETRSLMKKISSDLHGLYDSKIQAHAQRFVAGKFMFMLRKWLVPGFDRRWRGMVYAVGKDALTFEELRDEDNRYRRFYSPDLKSFQEGNYTTAVRFVRSLIKEGEFTQLFMLSKTNTWNSMTDAEKANVRKTTMEIVMFALTIAAAHILKGLAMELPEEEAAPLMFMAFGFRRLHQELMAYVNPVEGLKLMGSPAASVSMIQKATMLIGQSFYDGGNLILGNEAERYESGRRKGDLKIKKRFEDVVPILSQTNRTVQDAMEYVFSTY